jgi:mannose-6-phosphate isomerase-like protein (cupin superfamily)
MPSIVPFRDLEPSWNTKQAKEPGYMRWLTTWVGGPAGYINTNPGTAIESTHAAIGMMYLPKGQRQAGKHIHGVAEIYIVLQGELEGFDASGHPHHASAMDCTYIPAGCPHGVRNSGLEDVILVWVHDAIERSGTAVYYADDHPFPDAPPIRLLPFAGLQPDWSASGATEPGFMRWSVNWVGGNGIANARVAIGMTVLEPGNTLPPAGSPAARLYVVIDGQGITDIGSGTTLLGRLDGLHVPAGEKVAIRNNGPESLRLLWVDELGSAPDARAQQGP